MPFIQYSLLPEPYSYMFQALKTQNALSCGKVPSDICCSCCQYPMELRVVVSLGNFHLRSEPSRVFDRANLTLSRWGLRAIIMSDSLRAAVVFLGGIKAFSHAESASAGGLGPSWRR
jgi:hypothetical protein